MTDPNLLRKIIYVVKEADERFEKAAEGGTKCWVKEYFIPALEDAGLTIIDEQTMGLELKKIIEWVAKHDNSSGEGPTKPPKVWDVPEYKIKKA